MRGTASPHLLDTYHSERHAAGKLVLENTQAQVLLGDDSEEIAPVREFLMRLCRRKDVNRALAEVLTCLDTHYSCPDQGASAHPWLGKMVPNFPIRAASKEVELTTLLAAGRGLLIDGTEGAQLMSLVPNNVDTVRVESRAQDVPAAILMRPDGHAVWIANDVATDIEALRDAAAYWFGCPASNVSHNGKRAGEAFFHRTP